jgi:hypothetical protein
MPNVRHHRRGNGTSVKFHRGIQVEFGAESQARATAPRPVHAVVGQQLLFPYSRQPSAHVWLMLIMEMGKDSSSAKGITFQPRKVVLRIHQDFIG